jgi:hypothetical protein
MQRQYEQDDRVDGNAEVALGEQAHGPDLSPGRFIGLIIVFLAFGVAVAVGYILAP